jgi:hypothetical protein
MAVRKRCGPMRAPRIKCEQFGSTVGFMVDVNRFFNPKDEFHKLQEMLTNPNIHYPWKINSSLMQFGGTRMEGIRCSSFENADDILIDEDGNQTSEFDTLFEELCTEKSNFHVSVSFSESCSNQSVFFSWIQRLTIGSLQKLNSLHIQLSTENTIVLNFLSLLNLCSDLHHLSIESPKPWIFPEESPINLLSLSLKITDELSEIDFSGLQTYLDNCQKLVKFHLFASIGSFADELISALRNLAPEIYNLGLFLATDPYSFAGDKVLKEVFFNSNASELSTEKLEVSFLSRNHIISLPDAERLISEIAIGPNLTSLKKLVLLYGIDDQELMHCLDESFPYFQDAIEELCLNHMLMSPETFKSLGYFVKNAPNLSNCRLENLEVFPWREEKVLSIMEMFVDLDHLTISLIEPFAHMDREFLPILLRKGSCISSICLGTSAMEHLVHLWKVEYSMVCTSLTEARNIPEFTELTEEAEEDQFLDDLRRNRYLRQYSSAIILWYRLSTKSDCAPENICDVVRAIHSFICTPEVFKKGEDAYKEQIPECLLASNHSSPEENEKKRRRSPAIMGTSERDAFEQKNEKRHKIN